ncbi:MAG: hypothetical protein K0S65_1831 [Labilithrix sp.]|nr:hypothetical protein [Labilithrix sp.]
MTTRSSRLSGFSFAGILGAALGLAVAACQGPDSDARIDPATAPAGPAFRPVAQVLVERCGTIDCHGSKYRNMRLFGFGSARLDPEHRPDAPDTTQEEVDRDYDAVVALEPDLIRRVVAEGGRAPERLTFFRKGTGAEAHKGGQRIVPGDDADACLRSWLGGTVDEDRCQAAVSGPKP